MWQSIRLFTPENNNSLFTQVCNEANIRGLKYMNFLIKGIGTIFIIHPHSPTDKMVFQGISGVIALEHPYSPQSLSEGTKTAFSAHLQPGDTPYHLWTRLHALHNHPALHPDT